MPVGRLEALARLREGQERMDALLAHLKGKELTRPATIGNGDWSAKDLIGHIATWEDLALGSIRDFGSHRTPWPERKGGVFSASPTERISAFNARTVDEKRGLSLREVKAASRRTHQELLSSIESLSDEDWKEKAFYPTPGNRRRTLAALLGAILAANTGAFRHNFDHLPDLEAFVRSSSRRKHAVGAVLLLVLAAACNASVSAGSGTSGQVSASVAPNPTLTPPVCDFRVGDPIVRNEAGANVPARGQAVIGNFDGVRQSGFIQIDTGSDGIVTIKSRVTGQPEKVEVCQLP